MKNNLQIKTQTDDVLVSFNWIDWMLFTVVVAEKTECLSQEDEDYEDLDWGRNNSTPWHQCRS